MPVKETNLIMKAKDFQSSFLSCPKDIEEILRKLFLSSKPFSDDLKRLLVINTKDCLDNKTNPIYTQKLKEGLSVKEIAEKLHKTEDEVKALFSYFDTLSNFEKDLSNIDTKSR